MLAGIALLFGLFREPVYVAEARVSVEPQGKLESEEARLTFLEEVRGSVVTQKMLDEVRHRAGWGGGDQGFLGAPGPRDFRRQERQFGAPDTVRGLQAGAGGQGGQRLRG